MPPCQVGVTQPSGSISIDGQNVAEVTLDSLRSNVAVVQQDSFLFTTTIENNIAYGNPWAKERRIERAAESAQLHNYVAGLPAGSKASDYITSLDVSARRAR